MHPDDRARTVEVVDAQINRGERVQNFEIAVPPQGRQLSHVVVALEAGRRPHVRHRARRHRRRAPPPRRCARPRSNSKRASQQRTRELAQANESLRKSERRFRALIEHGSDSIALIDADSRILYLSPAVTNVEGYQPEELLGRLGTEHTHPDDLPVLARRASRSCSRSRASRSR